MNAQTDYDVVIVGAAAAGLTAAMYASRRTLRTLVISKDIGGQASLTTEIENYPAKGLVDGFALMTEFKEQAEKFGATVRMDEATHIRANGKTDFTVQTLGKTYTCHGVILAFGLTPRDLGVPGEEKFKGRGVSTCATCDAPLYKGKTVAVAGVGDAALDAVVLLSRLAKKVYYINPRDTFIGPKHFADDISRTPNITTYGRTKITEVYGQEKLEGIKLDHPEIKTLAVDGVFAEMGYRAKVDWIKDAVHVNPRNQIIIDEKNMTSVPGIFAAGDITTVSYKQIVVSAGEGAKAALSLYQYLQAHGVVSRGAAIDWGVVEKV